MRNSKHCELQLKIQKKLSLINQLEQLRKINSDYNERYSDQALDRVDQQVINLSNDICFAEMELRTFQMTIEKAKMDKVYLMKDIEEIKPKLKKIDELLIDIESANETGCGISLNEEGKMKHKENQRVIVELKHKIEEGGHTYNKYSDLIKNSNKRIVDAEKVINCIRHRNNKYYNKILFFKEHIKNCQANMVKYKLYKELIMNQYNDLKSLYKTTDKNTILRIKDGYGIRLQSKRNAYMDKVLIFKKREEFLNSLKADLNKLKIEKEKWNKLLLQSATINMKESDKSSIIIEYLNVRNSFIIFKDLTESKLTFLTKIASGIAHIIYLLQDYDEYQESFNWHGQDITLVTEDKDCFEITLLFSKLLLALQERIEFVNFVILQKIKHMDLIKNKQSDLDDAEYTEPVILFSGNRKYSNDILASYLGHRKQSESNLNQFLQSSEDTQTYDGNDDLGRYIIESPRSKQDRKIDLMNSESMSEENKRELMELSEQAFDIRRMPKRVIFNRCISSAHPDPVAISEQNFLNDKFKKSRMKTKIESEANSVKDNIMKKTSQKQRKKRVTNLTLEVMRAMKNKPPELVETATDTFVNLNKIKGLDKGKLKREVEVTQKSLPNYMSVILNMKKSRNNEKIGKIASKCSYFIIDKPETNNDVGQRFTTSKYTLRTEVPNDAINFDEHTANFIQKRIKNLKTLNKLDQWSSTSANAFDAFCTNRVDDTVTLKPTSSLVVVKTKKFQTLGKNTKQGSIKNRLNNEKHKTRKVKETVNSLEKNIFEHKY